MLIKTLCGRPLTALLAYSMQLQSKPVQLHFANNFKAAREQIQKVSSEFNMSKEQSRRLFHFYPQVFKPQSKQFDQFKERVEWVKQLSGNETDKAIGAVLEKLMFNSDYLVFQMSKNHFDAFIEALRTKFVSAKQIQTIFSKVPNLLCAKLPTILDQKLTLLSYYLTLSTEQAMEIFEASPFLLAASTRKLRESIIVLHNNYGLTKEEIVEQMKVMGEIFLLGGPNLKDIYKTPIKWGLTQQETKQIFLKNPLLFFNYPYDVMPYKRKILRYLNFTSEMGKIMIKQYPQILIWSIRSLEEKALFINNRLEIKMDPRTVELLVFNFNKTLRPRGEILVKSRTAYNNDNIAQFMKLTNEEFAERINVPIQKLNEEIAKFPISMEMDFRRSNVLTKIGAKEKFIKLAQAYQH